MSEESIDAVSQSLSTLSANLAQNQKILEKGSNTLVSWASSTGKAGQNWTTFSRLTSGTGIWKLQNYLRGTLEMIGKFSDSTKNQIKEQTENITNKTEALKQLKEALALIDHKKLTEDKKEVDNLNVKINDVRQRLININKKQKLLDGIPCGDGFPTCKFIKDANIEVCRLTRKT